MNISSHSTGSVSIVLLYRQPADTRWSSQAMWTPPLYMVERGPGGEARHPRPLSFPHPPLICLPDGDWQLQVLPGAPGTARQGRTRIIVSTNDGGNATQPRAPGHERPRAALRAARHGRLSAATRAPGADVPPTTTAGAPGQYRLSAAPRAPGHGRPLAITAEAPCRDRLSAVPAAPDHDRSDARHTMAPGHGRPLAALSAAGHDRPRATLRAPGADVPLATTAGAPGQHRLRAMAIATAALPAGLRRLRQEGLPRVPANPRTLIYPHSHHTASSFPRQRKSGHVPTNAVGAQHVAPVPPRGGGTTGGPNGRPSHPAADRPADSPSPPGKGPGGRSTSLQAHPAIQVPPHPRSCSTAHTGLSHHHPSRAPPTSTHRKPILANRFPPLHHVERGRVAGHSRTTPGSIRAAVARHRMRRALPGH